ncbi:MAG TPA: cyclic nucleotide-binding domain-containing protein [Thiotrichaceae bacterium]|jgi:CRP-like cAMP-binding protein|nr:cyclic nucleotide-binding domain-containing protein [Thiotrichaceae bacterium]HIM08393.1 cyclic nucleotide-binding domain-containing protein [Gammaproteobacteria bacterium]
MKDSLKNLLFFSYLTEEQMDKIMTYIEPLELNAGDILFEEGDTGDYVCYITSGSLEVIKMTTWQNFTTVITTLYEGSCIGEMALIDHAPRSATIRAYEKTRLAILTQKAFDVMLDTEPELGVNILKGVAQTLSDNLRATTDKLADEVAA